MSINKTRSHKQYGICHFYSSCSFSMLPVVLWKNSYDQLKEEDNENKFSLYIWVLCYFSMWMLTKIDRDFTVSSSMGGHEKQRKAFSRIGRQGKLSEYMSMDIYEGHKKWSALHYHSSTHQKACTIEKANDSSQWYKLLCLGRSSSAIMNTRMRWPHW